MEAGKKLPDPAAHPCLSQFQVPEDGSPCDLAKMNDHLVDNLANSEAGVVALHNYWDNTHNVIVRLSEGLRKLVDVSIRGDVASDELDRAAQKEVIVRHHVSAS